MFAVKITLLATATCLMLTRVDGEVPSELLDLVGLFPSTYDYTGRAFDPSKVLKENYLNEEDQRLISMVEDLMEEEEEDEEENEEDEEEEERLVTTNVSGDDMGKGLANAALEDIKRLKWDVQKRFQRQWTNVPYKAGGADKNMRVELRDGTVKGLGSLTKKSATLNKNANTITMQMGLTNLIVDGNYKVSVPGAGAAPANNAAGHVQIRISSATIDAVVKLDDTGLPLQILSFNAKSGVPTITQATNLSGNNYGPVYRSAFGEALRQITTKMLNTNVKVRFNKGQQNIKKEGSYNKWL